MHNPTQFKTRRWALVLGFLVFSAATVHAQSTSSGGAPATSAKMGGATSLVSTNPTYLHDILPLFLGKCSRCHNDQSTFLPNWLDYQTAYLKRNMTVNSRSSLRRYGS